MLWFLYGKSYIIMRENKELKIHRLRLSGCSLCPIRSNQKQRPDLYQAYIGMGQMSNTAESELNSLERFCQ